MITEYFHLLYEKTLRLHPVIKRTTQLPMNIRIAGTTTAATQNTIPHPEVTCDDEACQNGAECIMLSVNEVLCFCRLGYAGDYCEISKHLVCIFFVIFLKLPSFCLKPSCLQLYSNALRCPQPDVRLER